MPISNKEDINNFIEKYNILENREEIEKLTPEENLEIFRSWIGFINVRDSSGQDRDYVQSILGDKLELIIEEYRDFMKTQPHILRSAEKKKLRQKLAKRKDKKKNKESWNEN